MTTTDDVRKFVTEARDKAKATTDAELAETARAAGPLLLRAKPAETLAYAQGLRDGVILACDQILERIGNPATVLDAAYLEHQRAWSTATFGPGERTAGVVDHLRKELDEVLADPDDITEWADLVILALDGAWRAGHEPQAILDAIAAKQARNETRTWPDWRTFPPGVAIEHVRDGEGGA